jgi:hypothetical protein
VSYDGAAPAAWGMLMSAVGTGGALMAAALLVYLLALGRNLLPVATRRAAAEVALPEVRWGGAVAADARAWTGPLAVALLVGLMIAFTVLAFELMKALPLAGSGGAAH